ncbi:uncharacterized protein LOC142988408 isoform X2 [Genypterus blacodes]|uniref:uncharacterized protein LOC142988408 isoform X2 n=1 Tax=Genypterus blacodes TaxID=154954 RepID=UPI003F7574D9
MSPAAGLHVQLASIMEVLANAAVAEICELVDSGYAALQLEAAKSRKENELLRRKLRLMELRAARASALRALLPGHRQAAEPGRSATPRGDGAATGHEPEPCVVLLSSSSAQETPRREDTEASSSKAESALVSPSALTATVIKVEDDEDSWVKPEPDRFSPHFDSQLEDSRTGREAPPLRPKQEVAEQNTGTPSSSWLSVDVSTCTSVHKDLPEWTGHDRATHRGLGSTQNPLREDPSCSHLLNSDVNVSAPASSSSTFPYEVTPASVDQQPAVLQEEPQVQQRKNTAGGWRPLDGVSRTDRQRREDGGGKSFVCTFCGKTLSYMKNLRVHLRVHTGEKPFSCALCSKRFSDASNLKRHQRVHTGEKRYGCVHCGRRFAQSGSLKIHMSIHTDRKQFRCSHCGKTFISAAHLQRHAAVHCTEKRGAPT